MDGRGGGGRSSGKGAAGRMMTLQEFVSSMGPLIDLEKAGRYRRSRRRAPRRWRGGAASCQPQTGLMGKTLLEFQPNKGDVLPPHKFGTHDVVALKRIRQMLVPASLGQGVVYRLKDSSITVAFDDIPEDGLNSPLRLEKLANEVLPPLHHSMIYSKSQNCTMVTYRRMKDALIQLSKGIQTGPSANLVPKDAISKALGSRDVFLASWASWNWEDYNYYEIILQEIKRGSKVLACAASNIAVDNIVERLARYRTKLVRLGHPARLLPQVLDSALDAHSSCYFAAIVYVIASYIHDSWDQALNSKLLKAKDRNTKRDIRKELKTLAKEERKRQQLAITDVLKNADVVLTTLTGASSKKLNGITFDLVVIDEAAQALEVACWMALLKGPRCILAGDHLQLPPTIQSVEAEKKGMGKTLFERLTEAYGEEITSMLTIQYRMHELIMNWSSKELYSNKIKAHSSVAGHMLYDLEEVKCSSSTEPTIILIDTTGCDMEEVKDEEESTMNEGEAAVSIAHAKLLVESGVHASDIGIITPYSAQVTCLKMMRNKDAKLKDLEISTVDGFQGREKEAIIISMVRSNSKKEVGFLSDHRRMNVAVTRARRQCCLVCDVETVSNDKFLKRLVEYFEENGEYLSASEYQNS
ncbi:hypothetical protein EJB05_05825 [Eragrostis curvula]|uniref:DNA helicase n=1 Tax=Eragrostis curvula TaxID=38414 RepID=A0A5J9WD62_9POAL|nr:hypothetical protein EJB05_05825 [Eragrostis curvula]